MLVLIFVAFIGTFFLLNLILPDRDFSDQENRTLQRAPEFTFTSLFDGSFTKNMRSTLPISSLSGIFDSRESARGACNRKA